MFKCTFDAMQDMGLKCKNTMKNLSTPAIL